MPGPGIWWFAAPPDLSRNYLCRGSVKPHRLHWIYLFSYLVIARWSRYGYEPGNLVWPHDLAVGHNSEVFVGEVFDANRVQKFRLGRGAPARTD